MSFNPRLPRGEATRSAYTPTPPTPFQSTPPTRGGDSASPSWCADSSGFNPRLPRGEATVGRRLPQRRRRFNPRLPRGEATASCSVASLLYRCFNPRLPRGEATASDDGLRSHDPVSIHASHAGRRPASRTARASSASFNPRLPRGEATHLTGDEEATVWFQSTPPTRGGDAGPVPGRGEPMFQSTPPTRGGDLVRGAVADVVQVSIHASHAGRRRLGTDEEGRGQVSIHASHAGRRPPVRFRISVRM